MGAFSLPDTLRTEGFLLAESVIRLNNCSILKVFFIQPVYVLNNKSLQDETGYINQ